MANYLKAKNRAYYDKHSKRSSDRAATRGERAYSRAWLRGFSYVWDNDGVSDISQCKTPFERKAFDRGRKFAHKVLKE